MAKHDHEREKTPDSKPGDRQQDGDRAPDGTRRAHRKADIEHDDRHVEEASEGSFPASDPPSYTPATSIGPDEADQGSGRKP